MKLLQPVSAQWLCKEFSFELIGPDREIHELSSLDTLHTNSLSFVLKSRTPAEGVREGTVFGDESLAATGISVIKSGNPRLDFIRVQHFLARSPGFAPAITASNVHASVQIGQNTVIENEVHIDEGTRIGHNVVIKSGTHIGKHCDIKSGSIIGEPGFGFERDESGRPIKMIHLGGVRIGDHVEIGSLNTVCRGALGDTVLEDYVKLDDHVHIAHNCHIGEGSMITACAELSGSITVGKNVWIAPNCSITQKIHIGDNSFIGIGSVVARSVEAGSKVFGNPAKKLMAPAQ